MAMNDAKGPRVKWATIKIRGIPLVALQCAAPSSSYSSFSSSASQRYANAFGKFVSLQLTWLLFLIISLCISYKLAAFLVLIVPPSRQRCCCLLSSPDCQSQHLRSVCLCEHSNTLFGISSMMAIAALEWQCLQSACVVCAHCVLDVRRSQLENSAEFLHRHLTRYQLQRRDSWIHDCHIQCIRIVCAHIPRAKSREIRDLIVNDDNK